MKNIIKTSISLLFCLVLFFLVSCDKDDKKKEAIDIPTETYEKVSEDDFNRELFYMNTLEFEVADPTVIYAEEGEGAGYFYAFGTSDLIGCHGIQCWRSKDLANWEYTGVALEPDALDTWAVNNYWAPEIIYDEEYGLYFLFYNAQRIGSGRYYLSVAYSENVMGPYIIPNDFENADGIMMEAHEPVIDFHKFSDQIPDGISIRKNAIDASPFIDPVTGDRYLYWSWFDNKQEIFGMKMTDWFTPQYDTVVQMTELGKTTVGGSTEIYDGSPALNEGPFMYYKDGTYFMTFSCFPYTDSNYQVHLAVSDNPLTGFEKVSLDDGGVVLATDPSWSHIQSAGHHQFVEVGDQLLAVYHTFYDRATIAEGRALAIDEVMFIENSEGQLTMHVNGPTYSLQPIPSVLSGYSNVAGKANVTATNVASGSSASYLNDGIVKLRENDIANETEFNAGRTEINFKFDQPEELKAVMVYNSYFIDTAFVEIESMELEYVCDADGNTKIAKIGKVPFDYDFYTYYYADMLPGAAAIAEFENLPVVNVKINISYSGEFNVSEIKLLAANNKTIDYKSDFKETYTYNNEVNLNHYKNQGVTLGGTQFYDATYGWDLSTDDGTENAYTTTNGIGDSYVYFKDVVATKFYAEAYISTFSYQSYALGNEADKFPKIGMCVRNKEACMFFYIDAANNYTSKQVGYTQSVYGASGVWDWEATEKLEELDIVYRNNELDLENNYVKMAIIRDGKNFYLCVNDEVIFKTDDLRNLGDNDLASVGFLGFSSPLVVKDYSITTSSSEVDAILNEFVAKTTGETLGDSNICDATSGWDLSHDDGTENAYVTSNKLFDSYIYFKGEATNKFYAEGKFAVASENALNNDQFPKFGFAIRNAKTCTFFYVDGSAYYTAQNVGYVESEKDNPGFGWQWNNEVARSVKISYNKTGDLNGEFVKLAVLRDGGTLYMFVNDELAFTAKDLYALGADDLASVGFLCFNTKLLVKDYSITVDNEELNTITNNLLNSSKGETLGDSDICYATSGWDLSHDDGTANAYVSNDASNDSYIYFKGEATNKFYAEGYFAVKSSIALNNDEFPKFGFAIRNSKACTFFYVDGSSGYTAQNVGYVQSEENNPGFGWQWDNRVEQPATYSYNKSGDLNGEFVKLAVLANGGTYYMFVNDQLVFTSSDLYGLADGSAASVGFLCFNTELLVKNYSITVDSTAVDAKIVELVK